MHQLLGKYYRRYNLLLGLKRVDLLFTVSNYSAKAIQQRFGRSSLITYNHIDIKPIEPTIQRVKEILGQWGIRARDHIFIQ